MPYRELKILFQENNSIIYQFHRRGFSHEVSEYLIEWPSDKVILLDGQNVFAPDMKNSINDNGHLCLSWKKRPVSSQQSQERTIEYTKQDLLMPINIEPRLWRYSERIKIKGNDDCYFRLHLHGHRKRLSAVKASSRAVFRAKSEGYIHSCGAFKRNGGCSDHRVKPGSLVKLLPTELADTRFHCSGSLFINWVIEIDENVQKTIS